MRLKTFFRSALFGAFALTSTLALAGVKIETWKAPSGASVFFVEARALPMLDVQVDFAAGSAFDPPGKAGLSGLTHGLLNNGAGDMDEDTIARRLADLGARLGGGLELERASVSLRTLSEADKRGPALAILAEVLRAPTYPAAVFEREREHAITGLRDALTRPDTLAGRAFSQAIYGTHPYAKQTTLESLAAIGRDDLVDFHRRHYVAARATVTIVGDVSRQDAEAIAQQVTAGLPRGDGPAPLPPVTLPSASEARIAHPAAQAHVLIGLPALKRGDPDFFPLVVGNYVLGGGGFVSRLMHEVREKRGYAYSVYSYFTPNRDLGPFQIGLQTKREQAGEALKLTREVLAKYLAEGPSEEELKAAKANIVGSFPLRLDSNGKILGNVATIGFYGMPLDWLDTYRDKAAAVTVADIRAAFARHVKPEALMTVIVGSEK
jgi:zinc protease